MFLLNATKSCLTLKAGEMLVAGSVNVHEVKFEFSDDWSDLVKTVTFRTVSDSRSVILNDEGECVIPWEVLKVSSPYLYVGLIGTRDAEVVLPTIWADLGEVRNGTEPGADVTDPTPTVYEQVLSELGSRANNLNVKDEKLQLRSDETVLSEVELPKPEASDPGTTEHAALLNRDLPDQHPIKSITGLEEALKSAGAVKTVNGVEPDEHGNVEVDIPEGFSGSWNDLTDKPFGDSFGFSTTAHSSMGKLQFNKISDNLYGGSGTVGEIKFTIGKKYRVKIAYMGMTIYTQFEGVANYNSATREFSVLGGNGERFAYTTSTGYVFVTFTSDNSNVANASMAGMTLLTIYEGTEVAIPLDEKYIPETIARTSDIPDVSDKATAPATAQIGQTIVVKAVDENGKPTEWEAADLPEGGAAIIDVVELPTENINEDSFYRLLTGTFVFDGVATTWLRCLCVESLPEVGEPATTDGVTITAYYSIQDNAVFMYFSEELSLAYGVGVGWYPADTLFPAFDITWKGVITDVMEDNGDGYYLLLTYATYQWVGKWESLKSVGWVGEKGGAEIFNNPSNIASAMFATARGYRTEARGENSVSEGAKTIAVGRNQHAQGRFNIADDADEAGNSKYAHIVGNGNSEGNRSNAHTLDWFGNAWFAGSVEGTALILTSPNGTRFKITASDDGALAATAQ